MSITTELTPILDAVGWSRQLVSQFCNVLETGVGTDLDLSGDLTVGDDATVVGEIRGKDKFFLTPTDADVTDFRNLVVAYMNGVVSSTVDGLNGLYFDMDLQFSTTGANGVNGVLADFFGGVTVNATQLGGVAGVGMTAPLLSLSNGGAVTNAATLWIHDAPTAASNNYALWVDSGATRLDGAVTMQSTLAVTSAITPTGGIAVAGGFAAKPRNVHTGGVPAQATTAGTNAATNTGGTVYLAEIFVPSNMTATGIAIFNGTAVAGKGKVMIYSVDSAGTTGTRIAMSETATGGTTMSGTTAYQLIPFDPAPVALTGPATYFIGAIYDTTTHDLRGHTIGSFAVGEDAGNTYATDSTFATVTLPTTFATTTGPIASLY